MEEAVHARGDARGAFIIIIIFFLYPKWGKPSKDPSVWSHATPVGLASSSAPVVYDFLS